MKQTIKIVDEYDEKKQTTKTELLINMLCSQKKTFKTISTGYSTRIIVDGENTEYFLSEKFSSDKFLFYVKKLKKEISESNIIVDEIPREEIRYFDLREKINEIDFSEKEQAFCVDINQAYLSVLLRDGFISLELFTELSALDKETRLKIVGCLATQKTIIEYKEGNAIHINSVTDDEMRNVFFYLCYEIGRTMEDVKRYCRKNYLFYWVDGIYFFTSDDYKCEPAFIQTLFSAYGFETKIEPLYNFRVKKDFENIVIRFHKDKQNPKESGKVFTIPIKNTIQTINKNNIKKTKNELDRKS